MIGGEEREMRVVVAAEQREAGEPVEDEGGVGVGREAGLDGLEVEEFTRLGNGVEERGGGEACGD